MKNPTTLGRWLITVPALVYTLLPPLYDLTETHVLHPEWTPHSRLHMVWLLTTHSALGALVLWLLWLDPRRHRPRLAGVISACVLGGFWVATATSSLYGGALSDVGGVAPVLGVDRNALLFSVLFVMTLVGIVLSPRSATTGDEGSSPPGQVEQVA